MQRLLSVVAFTELSGCKRNCLAHEAENIHTGPLQERCQATLSCPSLPQCTARAQRGFAEHSLGTKMSLLELCLSSSES